MGLRLGAVVITLNGSQSAAWHSPDAGEREEMRDALRRRARRELEASDRAERAEIRDLGGALLERVERSS